MGTTPTSRRGSRIATYHILAVLLAFDAAAAAPPLPLTEAVLEVSVNSPIGGEALVVLRDPEGHPWLEDADFTRLRLKLPPAEPRDDKGRHYYPVLSILGASVDVDEAAQHLTVNAPAAAFATTRIHTPARREPGLTLATPGAFINYQLSDERSGGSSTAGAFGEVCAFAAPGLLTNTIISRSTLGRTRTIRLDSTMAHDFAERLETLSLGDSVSDPGSWGNAVRFAGIRWARNFGIRPDLVTTPLLTGSGNAVVPSTVDVFLNNQRVSTTPIPPGPFVIDNLPTVSGSGDIRLVVRDALGREQVLTQSFYSGASLLAEGLQQYSVDLGWIREDYAVKSFHYGRPIGAATYRRGLTDAVTVEGHAEVLAGEARAVGVNLMAGTGRFGTLTATLAGGGDASGRGVLSGVGYEHHAREASLVLNTLYASSGFRRVGDTALVEARYKQRTVAQASVNLGRAGMLSVADVVQSFRAQPRQSTVSLTHGVSFGAFGSLGLTVSRTTGSRHSSALFLNWTLGLNDRRAVTANLVAGSGAAAPPTELYGTVLQNPPVGTGSGWRLTGATTGNYDADWRGQFESADVEVESARTQGISGARFYVRGAATMLEAEVRAARSVTSSFAVVDVAGIADVPVYLENQLVARTDRRGRAVLPNVRAYEDNRITIDPQELPLDTDVAGRLIVLAPANRSGVVARFPVERVHAATFRLVRADGRPVPTGAMVDLNGGSFPVALDGMSYVTSLDRGRTGVVSWDQGGCRFELPSSPSDDPLPDLGTVTCRAAPDSGDPRAP